VKTFARTAALLVAFACPAAALAHAFLDRAVPAVGGKVHGPPAEARLHFSQPLEPAFSTLKVLDSAGRQVDRMDKGLDPRRVGAESLAPEARTGRLPRVWRVLSADTHVTEGDFTFEVAP